MSLFRAVLLKTYCHAHLNYKITLKNCLLFLLLANQLLSFVVIVIIIIIKNIYFVFFQALG